MKRAYKAILLLLICALIAQIPARAIEITPFASKYISSYRADTYASAAGRISIMFSITGAGRMDRIGASYIYLYEINNGNTKRVASYTQSTNSEFVGTNRYSQSGEVYYTKAVSSRQYYAIVKMFAEKDGGFDSRTYTTAVIVAK